MKYLDARKSDWDKTRVKGKKSFILMHGVVPFAIAAILGITAYIFVGNSESSFSLQHMSILYFGSVIVCSLCGGLYSNNTWKSNVKEFGK